MKYCLTCFFYVTIVFTSLSQDTITYLNEYYEKVCCKDSAFISRIGTYDQGVYDGIITDYLPSGKIYKTGFYENWVPSGYWKWYFKNGEKMCTGDYLGDEFEIWNGWDNLGNKTIKGGTGYFKWYNAYNGKVSSEGNYKKGKKEGLWIHYNLQGIKIEEKIYVSGKDSVLNVWDKTGNKKIVENGNGEITGYYKNGKVNYVGSYVAGKREGTWIWYFQNGKTQNKITYQKGKSNGKMYYYYENGTVRKELTVKNGKKNGGVVWYYPTGVMKCKGSYEDDQQSDTWTWYYDTGIEKSTHLY